MRALGFEQLDQVRRDIVTLMPGYYRRELDPFAALENQQGNCFTSVVIAAVAISLAYDVESSVVWSERLHARKLDTRGMPIVGSDEKGVLRDIQHMNLVVPRGVDEYDILALSFGEDVQDGQQTASAFQKAIESGRIFNYNFLNQDPKDENVADIRAKALDDPILVVGDEYEIRATEYGRECGMVAMDWQKGADEYLAALDQPPIDYERLASAFMPRLIAMRDWRRTQEDGAKPRALDSTWAPRPL